MLGTAPMVCGGVIIHAVQLYTLIFCATTVSDSTIEEGSESGKAGADDGDVYFDYRPDAGFNVGPWCDVSAVGSFEI